MTYTQTIRLLLFGLLLSASVSCFLFAFHLFFLLDRFAKDVAEVMATWELIRSYLIAGSLLFVGGMLARKS